MTFYLSAASGRTAHFLGECVPDDSLPPSAEKKFANPALLVSYVFLDRFFLPNREKLNFREWVMDSGAYSAHNSGVEITLAEYIKTCRRLLDEDKKLKEVFALDVIGDPKASAENCAEMWSEGIPAVPCFHIGEPERVLFEMAEKYPKIAVGGMVGMGGGIKERFIGQVFARVWPKKIHGFGIGSEKLMLNFPFDSVDATNWEIGACAFGRWHTFGNMSVKGKDQNLISEVEHCLRLERRAESRWKKIKQKAFDEN